MLLGAIVIAFAAFLYLNQAQGENAAGPVLGDPGPDLATPSGELPPSAVRGHIIGRAAPVHTTPGAPNRVIIPVQHIDVPVVPIQSASGVLTPPSNPQELGWWVGGAQPGATRGSALITGHTVHTGGGALDNLNDLVRGNEVIVLTDHGRLDYRVLRVVDFTKGRLADDAQRLFNQDSRGRLVLITCSDWNGVEYLSNTVVTAVAV